MFQYPSWIVGLENPAMVAEPVSASVFQYPSWIVGLENQAQRARLLAQVIVSVSELDRGVGKQFGLRWVSAEWVRFQYPSWIVGLENTVDTDSEPGRVVFQYPSWIVGLENAITRFR